MNSLSLDPQVKVYDAEIEGFAIEIEKTRTYIQTLPEAAAISITRLHFYMDYTMAIHRIFNSSPGKAAACLQWFCEAVFTLFDHNPLLKVEFTWVPGHHNIQDNERAGQLAKDVCSKLPV